jgi:hypothetical protein
MHRSITTISPAASATCLASSETIPSCNHSTLAPTLMGLTGDLRRLHGGTKDFNDVDRPVDLGQRARRRLAEELAAARVHRQDAVALLLQIARNGVRRLGWVTGDSHDRDGVGLGEDANKLLPQGRIHHSGPLPTRVASKRLPRRVPTP